MLNIEFRPRKSIILGLFYPHFVLLCHIIRYIAIYDFSALIIPSRAIFTTDCCSSVSFMHSASIVPSIQSAGNNRVTGTDNNREIDSTHFEGVDYLACKVESQSNTNLEPAFSMTDTGTNPLYIQ